MLVKIPECSMCGSYMSYVRNQKNAIIRCGPCYLKWKRLERERRGLK